uniref:Omp28-related outer membrane protein n=1 Tax=Flavobacterium sp. TaxID=239 RepID=UPI0040495D16
MKKFIYLFILLIATTYFSCSNEDEPGTRITSITLLSTPREVFTNNEITFNIFDNTGINRTNNSIIYVNGDALTGNTYTPTASGRISVYATYSTFTSVTSSINVLDEILFKKRVLIENYTGTGCATCPNIFNAIDLVQATTDNSISVNIYSNNVNEPFGFFGILPQNNFSLPYAMLNRTVKWDTPEATNINQVINLTSGSKPRVGLALDTSISGNTATVNVSVRFGATFSDLKLVVYAIEDGIIFDQQNSTALYGGANPIVNFVHNGVLRDLVSNGILGEVITGTTGYNENYNKTFTYTIPSSIDNANLKFVAFVLNSNGSVVNIREASSSEIQGFEIE